MKQEDKDLLVKDICARLPYKVKIVIQDTFKYSIVPSEYHVLDASNFSDIFCFNYKKFDKRMKKAMRERPNDIVIKPYLFPLSSMTEEQKKEFISVAGYETNEEDCGRHKETYYYDMVGHEDKLYPNYDAIDYLYKNHIDVRGLIPMGLANDATGLNIY